MDVFIFCFLIIRLSDDMLGSGKGDNNTEEAYIK